MIHDLLPVGTESPRCSEFARSIGVLPRGTGLFLQRVLLVSVPTPWPKPALAHPRLAAAAGLVKASAVSTRLFAAEPLGDATLESIEVEVFERSGEQALRSSWSLDDSSTLELLIGEIAQSDVGSLGQVAVEGARSGAMDQAVPPTFLVCTQGSHDQCCGTTGAAFADELVSQRPGYEVRRVSHTGGHRFAPTLIAFPEGRTWAFVDLSLADRIAGGATTAQDHRDHDRGWWGAKTGPAQVAECAVRAATAGQPFTEPQVRVLDHVDGTMDSAFEIAVGADSWRVDVEVGREIPTITCEAPGGLPAKPGREYHWTIKHGD